MTAESSCLPEFPPLHDTRQDNPQGSPVGVRAAPCLFTKPWPSASTALAPPLSLSMISCCRSLAADMAAGSWPRRTFL